MNWEIVVQLFIEAILIFSTPLDHWHRMLLTVLRYISLVGWPIICNIKHLTALVSLSDGPTAPVTLEKPTELGIQIIKPNHTKSYVPISWSRLYESVFAIHFDHALYAHLS